MADADEEEDTLGKLRQPAPPRPPSERADISESAQNEADADPGENREEPSRLVQDNGAQDDSLKHRSALDELLQKAEASPLESRTSAAPDRKPSTPNLLDIFEKDVPRRPSFSPRVSEDAVTASLPASLSTALVQAREARAAATAERAERTERVSGSRSTSKDSVRTDLSMNVDWASSKAKDMFRKGVMSSKEAAARSSSSSARAFPKEQLKKIGDELREMRERYESIFVEKLDFFSVADRVARLETSLEEQLGKGGNLPTALSALRSESKQHLVDHHDVLGKIAEINAATVNNTARLRDEQHRVENAADHAFRTAKNLEQVSNSLTFTREALGEDVTRMAKAVQALATEVKTIDQEHRTFLAQQANEKASMEGGDGYRGWFIKIKQQMQDQEYLHSVMVRDLQYVKQQFDSCATEADLKTVQEKLQDLEEENGRLQEFVHEKFFEVQDQERREMMDKFAAKWDPYNKGRLLRGTLEHWANFVRHMNKTREALRRVKQVYAKTHITSRLRSWWYLMQRDHTDSQFRSLSENLETQEAKLEGARGALLRHEKVTAEQSRSLQYRVLAVEKGLEAAERDKATKEEMHEKFNAIEDRLQKELSLEPIRQALAELQADVRRLQVQKHDEADAAVDREKTLALSSTAGDVGAGAARGLGIGPLSHLLQNCQGGLREARQQVSLAVDLAQRASSCCAELPTAWLETRSQSWWQFSDAWPPHVAKLLTSLTEGAREATETCKAGVAAALRWAEAASQPCQSPGRGTSTSEAEATATLHVALEAAETLATARTNLMLVTAELIERHWSSRPLAQLLRSLSLGTRVTWASQFQDAEPALLVRFFCAAASTALLELRTINLAAHVTWMGHEDVAAEVQEPEVMTYLRTAGSYLQLEVLEQADVYRRLEESREPASLRRARALGQIGQVAASNESGEALLVIGLSLHNTYSQAMHCKEEVRRHLPTEGVKVLLLEDYFLKISPQLSVAFRSSTTIDQKVELVARPAFGLHFRDADLWDQAPSLARVKCVQARVCWRMQLREDVPGVSLETSRGDYPSDPGCWYRLPSGCPTSADLLLQQRDWRRDTWGEQSFGAGSDARSCLELRRNAFNRWCGIEDVQMHYVPSASIPQAPRGPRVAEVLDALSRSDIASIDGVERFEAEAHHPGLPRAFESYVWWHANTLAKLKAGAETSVKFLVWACQPSLPCGGHGDRLKGILATFVLAVLTGRLFLLDSPDPWDLRLFLEPALLDWRSVGLAGYAAGKHVIWDHDHFEETYLQQLLETEDPIWIMYTNKKSLLGPILRSPLLTERAKSVGVLEIPHLTKQVWSILFRPTPALEKQWRKLQDELGEGYIALHYRAGDITAGFGMVNGEVDIRSPGHTEVLNLLSCAHHLEQLLELPSSTRWYLTADTPAVTKVAQVQTWQSSGKLVVRNVSRRAHLVKEGLVPPCGSLGEEVVASSRTRRLAHLRMTTAERYRDRIAKRTKGVGTLCSEFRNWLVRHDESLKRKAEISETDTKADAQLVEQVLVLMAKQADQLATMVSSDLDQLRLALTRFLEISPDFRKASLSIGMEPQEQCVACRALPRKVVNDAATGSDGSVYRMGVETVLSAAEQTQKVLADKLRFPLSLSSSLFVGCTGGPQAAEAQASAIQPLPLLRQMVVAESGWLTGKESGQESERAGQRKLVQSQEIPVPVATPRSKRRPPSAQDQEPRDRPQSVRSYFPAVDVRGAIPNGRRSR
ncbi:HERC1 [Symbiodinium natans]|uniref:HERC1 protein n=1 Tax=Symbiodinium natans TaxID=878477 RepID=A0A812JFQ0_9DINO|nr:HERC1 [Symbiodinium natans]